MSVQKKRNEINNRSLSYTWVVYCLALGRRLMFDRQVLLGKSIWVDACVADLMMLVNVFGQADCKNPLLFSSERVSKRESKRKHNYLVPEHCLQFAAKSSKSKSEQPRVPKTKNNKNAKWRLSLAVLSAHKVGCCCCCCCCCAPRRWIISMNVTVYASALALCTLQYLDTKKKKWKTDLLTIITQPHSQLAIIKKKIPPSHWHQPSTAISHGPTFGLIAGKRTVK